MGSSYFAPPRTSVSASAPADRRWFVVSRPVANPRIRLFCFPYAGGNATLYAPWARAMPSDVELVAIQPPGRATRFREPAFDRLEPLLEALLPNLVPLLQQPYVFFGHSMGALVAFELTRLLRQEGLPLPSHLVVSGRRAPHWTHTEAPMHDLPDAKFLERLKALNGTPEALLREPELMAMVLPTLRADFAVLEHWQHQEQAPLPVPITALGGTQDDRVPLESLNEWQQHTTGSFNHALFEGDHFYLNTERGALINTLVDLLDL